MFTGIITHTARVASVDARSIGLKAAGAAGRLKIGSSYAVNGACLTVVRKRGGILGFDVSAETFSRTNLGDLAKGDVVNGEFPLKVGDSLGGHLVSGHIDACAPILEMERLRAGFVRLRVGLPGALRGLVAEKGSVAVDGVSLTVSAAGDDFFEAALIPETLSATNLGARRAGQRVNLEADLIGRYVLSILESRGQIRA